MNRSKQIVVAASLTALIGVLSILSGTRILSAGSAGLPSPSGAASAGGPPFWAGLLFFSIGVALLFGAYGTWKNQKWGKVVSIALSAVQGLFVLGDIVGTFMRQVYPLTVLFVAGELACILIIVLLLQRPRAASTT